jgi:hypothetical protein
MTVRAPAMATMSRFTSRACSATAELLPNRLAVVAVGTILLTGAFVCSLALDAGGTAAHNFALLEGLLFVASLVCLVLAVIVSGRTRPNDNVWRGAARVAKIALLVVLGVSAVVSFTLTAELLPSAFDPTVYGSDAAAFNHFDAELVLQGINPYSADGELWSALHQFPSAGATPLRASTPPGSEWGPSLQDVRHEVAQFVADPSLHRGEFSPQSLHSYPALSFLVYVPLVWAGAGSTMLVSLLALIGLMVALVRWLPREYRVVGCLVLLANWPALLLTLKGGFEAVALLPAVFAFQFFGRRWLSPALLGLACAVKQIVWPLALLYLVYCARKYGWRDALTRGCEVAAAFLVPNLPFIVLAPGAWAHSMLLPMTLPLFPDGVGLVALAKGGVLPLWSPFVYTSLEALALAAVLSWFAWKRPVPRPELALLLAFVPFALAWRSLFNYFVWLPGLATVAAVPMLSATHTKDQATRYVDTKAQQFTSWALAVRRHTK